jgi:hypothetical protein
LLAIKYVLRQFCPRSQKRKEALQARLRFIKLTSFAFFAISEKAGGAIVRAGDDLVVDEEGGGPGMNDGVAVYVCEDIGGAVVVVGMENWLLFTSHVSTMRTDNSCRLFPYAGAAID